MSLTTLASAAPTLPTVGALAVMLLLWTIASFARKRSASPNPQGKQASLLPSSQSTSTPLKKTNPRHPVEPPPPPYLISQPDDKTTPSRTDSFPKPEPTPSSLSPPTDPLTNNPHPTPTALLPWRTSFALTALPQTSSSNMSASKGRSSSIAARKGSMVPLVIDEEGAGRGSPALVSPPEMLGRVGEEDLLGVGVHLWSSVDGGGVGGAVRGRELSLSW